MKSKDVLIRLAVCLILIFSSSLFIPPREVQADDWLWKFNVPIILKDIPPNLPYVLVSVRILDDQKNGIAQGSTVYPLKGDGSLSETVAVYIYPKDVWKGHLPGEGKSYEATFSLGITNSLEKGPWYGMDPPAWKAVEHKPGTPFILKVSGKL